MTTLKEKRVIRHKPEHLYALVADVKSYPEFLPWCMGARIREQDDSSMRADLMIGFRLYREKFTSYVDLDPASRTINVEYADGPFKYLKNAWVFRPHPDGCEIDFYVDFEFKSALFQSVVETLFGEAVKKMVRAFETRADALHDRVS
ncbi:MAG: type II toxin-antitoxin system RatA family toxin [Alphaproteobacteria bacterium]|nr:type II toxin-antitoxin system RatA family toxin [Alphaproteobacteria bacterium]